MHKEVLSKEQIELLTFVKQFQREFYLVGRTAIALQIGHRQSIDFDFFKFKSIRPQALITKIEDSGFPFVVTRRVSEQMNVTISNVKFTFYEYPFKIQSPLVFENTFKMPELLDLAAMKAYALGRRSKWKDYVDMYFLLRDKFSIDQISERAIQLYEQLFSPKQFRAQLSYFADISYAEPVDFVVPAPSEDEIKAFLIEKALEI